MRFVNRQTFLALPAGTVFSKYRPKCFQEMQIKAETCGSNDFWSTRVGDALAWGGTDEFIEITDRAEAGESVAMDFYIQDRDGLYDADQIFAVFERADVEALIERLKAALVDSTSEESFPPHG